MTVAGARPWRLSEGCVIVRVRITPKSSKNAIDGVDDTPEGPAFKARVRAVPQDGEANEALERLIAGWLDVPKRSVKLHAGAKSRVKSLRVDGDPKIIESRLAARLTELN